MTDAADRRTEYLDQWHAEVTPPDWQNPTPDGRYNLVVVGAGPAGLVCAAGAAGLGAKVALIERHQMGGDCLNVGCVPSKGLIRSARVVSDARAGAAFGVTGTENAQADFAAVMARMYRLRADMSHHDSPARFTGLGVDVYLGDGVFTGPNQVSVAGQVLDFKRAVIATGARAVLPPIEGLAESDPLTNENVFDLKELPPRLAVIGSGPIGCELGQSFARFGSQVTLLEQADRIMVREEARAAGVVTQSLLADGIDIRTHTALQKVTRRGDERILTVKNKAGELEEIVVDQILVGVGRAPNVDGLGLEAAGVQYDPRKGVVVNEQLCTSNSAIYGAGDVCFQYKFTHAADACARIVLANALFPSRQKTSSLVIPWATYTQPEVAHVGLTEGEIAEQGLSVDIVEVAMNTNDRSRLDGDDEGYARVYLKPGSDTILGATMVSDHAGDMIGEMTLAITHGIGLKQIANTIHPYPSNGEMWKKVADEFNRGRLTPTVKKWMTRWLRWSRR